MEHPIVYDKDGIVIRKKGPHTTLFWNGENGDYRQISFVGNLSDSAYEDCLQENINTLLASIKKCLKQKA